MSQTTKNRILGALTWTPLLAGVCAALFFLLPTGGGSALAPVPKSSAAVASSASPTTHSLPAGVATRNIEDLRVGDRVLAHNPEISDEERASWEEPDWTKWRWLHLEMPKPDGSVLNIDMIRPLEWLEYEGVEPGVLIHLDMSELGAEGLAWVASVGESPPIQTGRGQVITATFSHPPSTQVLNVLFEGDAEPIGVTGNHLFWSADRKQFVAIGEMNIGENVVTYDGITKQLEFRFVRTAPQHVYNVEVYGEHVYYVGEQGWLAHNIYSMSDEAKQGADLYGPWNLKGTKPARDTAEGYAWRYLRYQSEGKKWGYERWARSAETISGNYTSGMAARDSFARGFKTSTIEVTHDVVLNGQARRHDVRGPAGSLYEIKVGYTTLGKAGSRTWQELERDILLKQQYGEDITWIFFRSGATKKGGPSNPLRQQLERHGIKIVIRDEEF